MAVDTATNNALSPDTDAAIPRIKLGEIGFPGLRVMNKQIIDESNRAFRFPAFLKTVAEMRINPTVSTALNVYKMMLGRVKWTVQAPVGATPEQIERAKFVEQCMSDMDNSWGNFMSETLSYLSYGFSVQEKVFRRRLRVNGSRYNDGLVGLRKIAPRSQDTTYGWVFDDTGRELIGVEQSLQNLESGYRYQMITEHNPTGRIFIPREKVLIFSADSTKNNPQGSSILKSVYLSYKYLVGLQENLQLGVAKDVSGIPVITLPPKYLSAEASPEDQAVFTAAKNIVDNLSAGTQRGIVFPAMSDPETKLPMFSVSLLESKGAARFDVTQIIKSLQDDILRALSCDVIAQGANNGGSFSLNDENTSLLSLALSHRLNEIAEVLNSDLIPQLFALNGWTDEELPKFVPGDLSMVSSEGFSKAIQRIGSVGLLEIDRSLLNRINEVTGIPLKPADEPVNKEILTGAESNAGKGMEPGRSGNGTAKIGGGGSKQDGSANNANNAA